MSRDDGFAVMDLSVDIVNDTKVRKLFRHAPDRASVAFVAYIATVAESWKAGKRVSIDDAWPSLVPFDKRAVEALIHIQLLDKTGRVPIKSWTDWYGLASSRRAIHREKWRRSNEKRRAVTPELPRGDDGVTTAKHAAVTAATVPLLSSPNTKQGRKPLVRRADAVVKPS